jgi:hypothetical protein
VQLRSSLELLEPSTCWPCGRVSVPTGQLAWQVHKLVRKLERLRSKVLELELVHSKELVLVQLRSKELELVRKQQLLERSTCWPCGRASVPKGQLAWQVHKLVRKQELLRKPELELEHKRLELVCSNHSCD